MSASIKIRTILASMCLIFSYMQIGSVQGISACLSKHSPPEDVFSKQHYDEVGYAKIVCLELASILHAVLLLDTATPFCLKLEHTITTSYWPFCGKNCNWKRADNKRATRRVMARALAMVQDFNKNTRKLEVFGNANQELLVESVELAVERLTLSEAADKNSPLIGEIYKLKDTYCQKYFNHRKEIAEEEAEVNRQKAIHNDLAEAKAQADADQPTLGKFQKKSSRNTNISS